MIRPGTTASRDELKLHALALYESGNFSGARAAYAALPTTSTGDLEVVGRLGAIAARMGDSAAVRRIDLQLAQWSAMYALGQPTYWRAHLAALAGRGSDAVSLLRVAIGQGYRPTELGTVTLHEEADFASLWKDPAFRELVRPRDGPAIIP